jgi:hypothetical protein
LSRFLCNVVQTGVAAESRRRLCVWLPTWLCARALRRPSDANRVGSQLTGVLRRTEGTKGESVKSHDSVLGKGFAFEMGR